MADRGPRDVEYLSPRQRAVIRHRVDGKTHAEIARITGYCRTWVTEIINSPAGREFSRQLWDRIPDRMADNRHLLEARARVEAGEFVPCVGCPWHLI